MCGAMGLATSGCRRPVAAVRGVPASQPDLALATRPAMASADLANPGRTGEATSPASHTFENAEAGLRLSYSGKWREKKSPDDLLMLVPIKGPEDRTITMDVPDVPKHLPGAMAMTLIQAGYIDDLRKHHAGLKVEQAQTVTMAACKARIVRSTWMQDGTEYTDVALLIVHADRVYILSLDSDLTGYPGVREEMDRIEQSLEWMK